MYNYISIIYNIIFLCLRFIMKFQKLQAKLLKIQETVCCFMFFRSFKISEFSEVLLPSFLYNCFWKIVSLGYI